MEKGVRNLKEDARPVTGCLITSHGPPVLEVDKDLDTVLDDLVTFFTLHIGHETHTAAVVLV
jgi:hypothetical protein